MKNIFACAIVAFIVTACGASQDYRSDSESFQVRQDLQAAGSVTLAFQQAFLYRSITIGSPQTSRCQSIATDYSKTSGTEVVKESLKIGYEAPEKHCAKRNFAKQCETHQYVYTFTCQFQTK